MKFRKKISFSIIVIEILLDSLVCCFPRTFTSTSYINENNWNVIPEPVCETLNFQNNNKSPIQCKSYLRCFPKNNNLKGVENTSNEKVENEFILPPEFSSAANYRELCNFPEVEYPLNAREMWKPNYWNSYKDVNTDNINPILNDYSSKVKSTQNIETKFKPSAKTELSTKSFSDLKKNIASLKNKELNFFKNNTSDNSNTCQQNDKANSTLENSRLCNISPLKNVMTNDNLERWVIDKMALDCNTYYSNVNNTSYLTSQPDLLACPEIFKKEIESILKTVADNIILTNLESTKNKFSTKEYLNKNYDVNLTFINEVTDKFDKEMTSIIKSAADNIMKEIEITSNNNQNSKHSKSPTIPDILNKEKVTPTTQAPIITDVCPDKKSNKSKIDTKISTSKAKAKKNKKNKKTSSSDGLPSKTISENDITDKKEATKTPICKSKANITKIVEKEDKKLVLAYKPEEQNIIPPVTDNTVTDNKEISLEEDFTTDSYPENTNWSYVLSTVAPPMSKVDIIWQDTNVIEPKSVAYPDELDQYFLLCPD